MTQKLSKKLTPMLTSAHKGETSGDPIQLIQLQSSVSMPILSPEAALNNWLTTTLSAAEQTRRVVCSNAKEGERKPSGGRTRPDPAHPGEVAERSEEVA